MDVIQLTEIAKGPRVEMTELYKGNRGAIVRIVGPKIYDVKLDMGIHVITGSHNFRIIREN